MRQTFTTIVGKAVRALAQARGGGSALPGLFVETIDPDFIRRTLSGLSQGIVLISGTNGKTTTTKMVVELLEGQGMRVFTNRTGSNFTRGVAAALLGAVDAHGKLEADIAVLELDEAHAVHFVKTIRPSYCLLLNVMRDQLDRFGEIDATAQLLKTVAEHTTRGVVINRDDPRLSSQDFLKTIAAPIACYGVAPSLRGLFPSDDAMRSPEATISKEPANKYDVTILESVKDQHVSVRFAGKNHATSLKLKGIYNMQNVVGAVALVRMIVGEALDTKRLLASLANVEPAFGRGETVILHDQPCELVLVKNPSGFRLSLKSFPPEDYATMIAINDNYADGKDMSWLWDVDFDSLRPGGVSMVSGMRAYDMALRLQYDEVDISKVEPDLAEALHTFIETNDATPKRIYCTYTAMLGLRRELSRYTSVEVVR